MSDDTVSPGKAPGSYPTVTEPAAARLPLPHKVTATHLTKLAIVYIRQSTPQQIAENRESLARQYALSDHAVALGWVRDRVVVIDDDLGLSGRTAEGRPGFQRLLAEVTMDHVGLVLGLEMSRLARSCKDWYQLLEVCALFGTLLADQDGLYDTSDPNDRLLLGLKGQISELELHTIRTRLERGRQNKARRGELFSHAPVGYVRTPAGALALDPDEQVRDTIRLLLEKFAELGTVHALVRYLRRHHIRLPVRPLDGPNRGQLEWRPVAFSTLYRILHNPTYAGTYAFGRYPADRKRRRSDGQRPCTRAAPMSEWQVIKHDCLPAYITWTQYLQNCERLRQNRCTSATPGQPRNGAALLAGLVVCAGCSHRMHALYSRTAFPRYECISHRHRGEPQKCPGLTAATLDALVAEQVLQILTPAGIELSLRAAADLKRERERLDAHWRAESERAAYEARLAERSYRAVDPENRLVARTLERRWEEALSRQREVQEGYDRFLRESPRHLSADELNRIRALAADIPALWNAVDTPAVDKKEILRALIERVTVAVATTSENVGVEIRWAGGSVSQLVLRRPVGSYERLAGFPRLRDCIRDYVAAGLTAPQIAERLNREGFRPPSGRVERYTRTLVSALIYRLGFSAPRRPAVALAPGEWWAGDLASELGVRLTRLRDWIKHGYVHCRKVSRKGNLVLWADADELVRLRQLRDHPRPHRSMRYPEELTRPKERLEAASRKRCQRRAAGTD